MAECHPVGFQWVMEAKARGAKVIHVDPRFTRTSAVVRHARPDPGRLGHRLPRRTGQLHPRERTRVPRVRHRVHERRHDHRRSVRRHRGSGWPLLRMGRDVAHLRRDHVAVRERRCRRPRSAATWPAWRGGDRRDPRQRWRRPGDRRPSIAGPDAAAPAVRVPAAEEALPPVHAGDGGGGVWRAAPAVPRGRRGAV